MSFEQTPGVPYEPSPEQIAEAARLIREKGFESKPAKGKRTKNPPWKDRDYYDAAGLPQPGAHIPCYNSMRGDGHCIEFESSK